MLEYLQPFRKADVDFIMFFQGEKENSISIQGNQYEDRGEDVGGSSLGNSYHIILCRDSKEHEDKFDNFDSFEAILVDPLTYISDLIPQGWYGIVAKKTTTSQKVVDHMLDLFSKHLYNN